MYVYVMQRRLGVRTSTTETSSARRRRWQRMVRAGDAGDGRVGGGARLSLSLLGEIRSRAGNSLTDG